MQIPGPGASLVPVMWTMIPVHTPTTPQKKQNSVRLPAWAAFQNAALWIQRSSSGQDEGHVLIWDLLLLAQTHGLAQVGCQDVLTLEKTCLLENTPGGGRNTSKSYCLLNNSILFLYYMECHTSHAFPILLQKCWSVRTSSLLSKTEYRSVNLIDSFKCGTKFQRVLRFSWRYCIYSSVRERIQLATSTRSRLELAERRSARLLKTKTCLYHRQRWYSIAYPPGLGFHTRHNNFFFFLNRNKPEQHLRPRLMRNKTSLITRGSSGLRSHTTQKLARRKESALLCGETGLFLRGRNEEYNRVSDPL